MLQIVTRMYFRDGVPLHSVEHRDVLYTNCGFLRSDAIDLPVGQLAPSTGVSPVSTVTVSITEHLEAEELDGTPAVRVSTGGLELFDDLGVVLSFGLNAVFSRNHDLVRRLVPDAVGPGHRQTQASRLFGRTFEGHRYVPPADLDEFRSFMTRLLALKREHFEAAMRAIKRIVGATQRAADDPTLAYVDIVAALESLSAGAEGPSITWDRMDARKRGLVDNALHGLSREVADRIRAAVMEADRLGVKARFVAFVLSNVSPSFFRAEAVGVKNPVRSADLERVVKQAYEIRSLNIHVLRELKFEAWILGSEFETVVPADELMLTHVGLGRLAQHVVKNYVASAPVENEFNFNWRAYLPGQVMMPLAPQYWVWQPAGFDHRSVARYFSGFVQHLVETLAGRSPAISDMTAVLERIEKLVPGTHNGPAKTMMVAIYVLWHRVLAPDHHRTNADQFLAKHEAVLHSPGVPAFVAWLLSGSLPSWSLDQWQTLATARRWERSEKRHLELPAALDAALQVVTAEALIQANKVSDARQHAAFAVEELPGNEQLLTWESALDTEAAVEINPWEVAVQPEVASPETSSEQQASADSDQQDGPGEADEDGSNP